MQQQLAVVYRQVVLAVAVRVLADVRVDQPGFVVADLGVSVLELNIAVLDRLHFRAGQDQARLESLHQEVVVPRLPVVAEDFSGCVPVSQFLISTLGSPTSSMSLDGPRPLKRIDDVGDRKSTRLN